MEQIYLYVLLFGVLPLIIGLTIAVLYYRYRLNKCMVALCRCISEISDLKQKLIKLNVTYDVYPVEITPREFLHVARNMLQKLLFSASFLLVVILAGCAEDEHRTPHPDKGAIVVQLDWSGISPDAIPDAYVLNVDGREQTASGTTAVVEQLVEPGEHTLLIYNRPEGITVEGDVASVDEVTATTQTKERAEEVFIQPLPGYLFTARQKITVVPDDTLRVTLPMAQRTRDLQFELTVTEGNPELIQSVKGVLAGIAGTFNLAEQQLTDIPANTLLAFTRKGNKLAANARLLGIVGMVQTLVLEIRFTDREDIHCVTVDLSEAMDGFNNDMTTTRKLTGSVETPIDMDITASITDWVDVEGSPVEAE